MKTTVLKVRLIKLGFTRHAQDIEDFLNIARM